MKTWIKILITVLTALIPVVGLCVLHRYYLLVIYVFYLMLTTIVGYSQFRRGYLKGHLRGYEKAAKDYVDNLKHVSTKISAAIKYAFDKGISMDTLTYDSTNDEVYFDGKKVDVFEKEQPRVVTIQTIIDDAISYLKEYRKEPILIRLTRKDYDELISVLRGPGNITKYLGITVDCVDRLPENIASLCESYIATDTEIFDLRTLKEVY